MLPIIIFNYCEERPYAALATLRSVRHISKQSRKLRKKENGIKKLEPFAVLLPFLWEMLRLRRECRGAAVAWRTCTAIHLQ